MIPVEYTYMYTALALIITQAIMLYGMFIVQGVYDVDPNNGSTADGAPMQDVVEKTGCEFKVSTSNRRYTAYCCVQSGS